ncbi:MAG TPA: RNA-binding protein [Armatimonadetes bacterium]|nr:RNA-binding protein [Armatimonadota bacterium]
MNNIYVGNLAYTVTEDELTECFGEYGEVIKINLITDKFSGQSKGFGFVEMAKQIDAEEAIKALNGFLLNGRNLKVNMARPREDRPSRKPRY